LALARFLPWQEWMSSLLAIESSIHQTFYNILDGVDQASIRTLYSLLCLGKFGPDAGFLNSLFKDIGVIHLLVLSGSQVESYSRVWKRFCIIILGDQRKHYFGVLPWAHLLGLGLFVASVRPDPPIVRALILSSIGATAPRLRREFLIPLCFIFHLGLFPEHVESRSFYLSWMCWAFMGLLRRIENPLIRVLMVTLFCQIGAIILTHSPWPSARAWCVQLLANIVLIYLFEKWVFSVCGCLLAMSALLGVLLSFAHIPLLESILRETMHPFLNGTGALVLVALSAFRYIQ